jgi:hypothetical protein
MMQEKQRLVAVGTHISVWVPDDNISSGGIIVPETSLGVKLNYSKVDSIGDNVTVPVKIGDVIVTRSGSVGSAWTPPQGGGKFVVYQQGEIIGIIFDITELAEIEPTSLEEI